MNKELERKRYKKVLDRQREKERDRERKRGEGRERERIMKERSLRGIKEAKGNLPRPIYLYTYIYVKDLDT